MKIIKTFIHSLLVIVVVLAGSFLSGTHAYAVEANQGVAMQVKVRLKLADGTIINNPPTEIKIDWQRNPQDPEGDGCNNSSGSLLFAASNPSQGQAVPQYNGASWMLYREGGTREAAVWAQTEDNNGNLTNNWDWIGRGGSSVGPCTCVYRRATVTLNGETQTKEFVQRGTGITGGPFNNGAATIAEFDFNAPPPPGVTPTSGPTGNPALGDLFFNAGAGGKEVGVSSQFETISTTPDPDQRNAKPRKYATSGKRSSFGGGDFYNPLLITQKVIKPNNTNIEDAVDYAGVAVGHAGNSGGFGGTEPFPTSGSNLNAFDKLKRFVAVPSTKNSDGSTPGPGYILLYAYNDIGKSEDDLFTSRPNPPFQAGNYYIYLPEGLNRDSDFGQWHEILPGATGVDIPKFPGPNNSIIPCTTALPDPTCYLTVKKGPNSDPDIGTLQWNLEIFPNMGTSLFTEVSFLKPKGQNKNIYKQQPQTP